MLFQVEGNVNGAGATGEAASLAFHAARSRRRRISYRGRQQNELEQIAGHCGALIVPLVHGRRARRRAKRPWALADFPIAPERETYRAPKERCVGCAW